MPDLAIIGSGPAALGAALYAARFGLTVEVLEKAAYGGLLGQISDLRNYPGYQGEGQKLAQQMQQQVKAYPNVSFRYGECTAIEPAAHGAQRATSGKPESIEEVEADRPRAAGEKADTDSSQLALDRADAGFILTIDGEEQLRSRAVLVASGASPRPLDFALEVPVSYCAICDGELARDRRVAVVGGANAAVQESIFLAPLASTLDLFTHSELKADPILQAELRQHSNVTIHEQVEPTPALLNQFDYVFVFIGQVPATDCLRSLPEFSKLLDPSGRILTGLAAQSSAQSDSSAGGSAGSQPILTDAASRLPHQTILPGLFAAGDVRSGAVHQVITAAGDGAAAAIEIAEFLNSTA